MGTRRLAQKKLATASNKPLMLAILSTSTRRSSPGTAPLLACLSWRLPNHITNPVPITAVPATPKKKYSQRSQGPAKLPMCRPAKLKAVIIKPLSGLPWLNSAPLAPSNVQLALRR
ncbi:hypothetical protein D9M73_246510 [compost metagenome]